jgi:hypothetical protein
MPTCAPPLWSLATSWSGMQGRFKWLARHLQFPVMCNVQCAQVNHLALHQHFSVMRNGIDRFALLLGLARHQYFPVMRNQPDRLLPQGPTCAPPSASSRAQR